MTEEAPKTIKLGVYKAITDVTDDMAKEGIAKRSRNQAQGYNFRGIDDTLGAFSRLLPKHNLTIIPNQVDRKETIFKSAKGADMRQVILTVDYTLVCSIDGSHHTIRTFGEAMDTGDKATPKALTAAYKYMMFQLFCVPVEGQPDADKDSPETKTDTTKMDLLIAALQMAENKADLADFKTKNKEIIDALSVDEETIFVKAYNEHVAELKAAVTKQAA